jgi:hypothetical protein
MADSATVPLYQGGDKVSLKHGSHLVGSVMEVTRIRSRSGGVLYLIYVPMDPEPLIVPVSEDEIEKA